MLDKETILRFIDMEVERKQSVMDEHYRIYLQGFIDGLRCTLNE